MLTPNALATPAATSGPPVDMATGFDRPIGFDGPDGIDDDADANCDTMVAMLNILLCIVACGATVCGPGGAIDCDECNVEGTPTPTDDSVLPTDPAIRTEAGTALALPGTSS